MWKFKLQQTSSVVNVSFQWKAGLIKCRISFCFGWWDWGRRICLSLSELPDWMVQVFTDIKSKEIIIQFQASLLYFLASKVRFLLVWANKQHMHVGWRSRGGLHGCQTLVSRNGQKHYLLWWTGKWCSMSRSYFSNFCTLTFTCLLSVAKDFEWQILFLVFLLYFVFPALTWITEVCGTDKTIQSESL